MGLHDILEIVTAVGALLIPGALYIVRNEIKSSHNDLKSKHDLLNQNVTNHIENDEAYQSRAEKSFERILNHLKLL